MKKALILITTAVILFFATSCSSNDDPGVGIVDPYHYSFTPRDVNYIWAVPYSGQRQIGILVNNYNQKIEGGNTLESNRRAIAKLWKNVDRPIPEIETYFKNRLPFIIGYVPIEQNFEYDLRLWKGLGAVIEPDYEETFCGHCMEYRTEGIESLKISADKPLFGEEAGASLNKYFTIAEGTRNVKLTYVSAINYEHFPVSELDGVTFGAANTPLEGRVIDIDRWVAHKPMVSPCMFIGIKEPFDLNDDIVWTFEMTTTAGKYFKVSHRAIPKPSEAEEYFPYLPEFMSEATLVK